MAGLAALLRTTPVATPATTSMSKRACQALSAALAPRGTERAERTTGRLTLLVRSALPVIHETDGCAAIVDGIAEAGTLIGEYVRRGPAALLDGDRSYALILADPARSGLVLARNGDGPPLYFARTADTVIVASEPGALIAAGVPADADRAVVERFLATGSCDDSTSTFFALVTRVLPGQVVLITMDRTVAYDVPPQQVEPPTRASLREAVGPGRTGCRLSGAPGTPAVLDAVRRVAQAGGGGPVPVYFAYFPGLPDPSGGQVTALPGDPAPGEIHRALPCPPAELDLDGYLRDVGEPLPDLDSYLIWATARATGGEVDVLLDGAIAGDHLPRLADRVASRYGVEVRFPLRIPGAPATPVPGPPMSEIITRLSPHQFAPLVHARLRPQVGTLAALFAGRRVDGAALFRRLLVERWLCLVAPPESPARVPAPPINLHGRQWHRRAIGTQLLQPHDPVVERLAYVASAAAARITHHWYLLVAAKPVAVAQGLARPAWQLTPGPLARLLGLATRRPSWQVQALIDHNGVLRAIGAATRAGAHREAGLPRADAVTPAQVSVVPPPNRPDHVADRITAALAGTLPPGALAAYRGCAVIGAGRLLGWAGPGDPDLALALAAGDPFHGGEELTPLVLAVHVPVKASGTTARRGKTARATRR